MKHFVFLLLPLFMFAQEKGYIDMHGGKKDSLIQRGNPMYKGSTLGTSSLLQAPQNKDGAKVQSKTKKEKSKLSSNKH